MSEKKILITGGAGFIGSHVVRRFVTQYPGYRIFNLDALTYAGNLANLHDIEHLPNYQFIKGDITDAEFINNLFNEYGFDAVIHLAAESHVDRSITNPLEFIMTNIVGTVTLLNAAKKLWTEKSGKRFYHISTDEVYGSLGNTGFLPKPLRMIPEALTLLLKQAPTILSWLIFTPIICLWYCLTAPTITARITSPKN